MSNDNYETEIKELQRQIVELNSMINYNLKIQKSEFRRSINLNLCLAYIILAIIIYGIMITCLDSSVNLFYMFAGAEVVAIVKIIFHSIVEAFYIIKDARRMYIRYKLNKAYDKEKKLNK